MPFVVRWPGRVKPGVSEALVSQVDFCASFAALAGQPLGPNDAPDSLNVLPALLGESPVGRDYVLEYSNRIAIRQGLWKFMPAPEGGGGKKANGQRGPQGGAALFDLAKDPGESENIAAQHPDVVERLSRQLAQLREQGRSRP